MQQSRAEQFAKYILEKNATIRETAKVFSYSKSTVHNDVSNKLKKINFCLYEKIQVILKNNFAQKHIKGGIATKNKYKKIKK
jgi:putative DeoR family transcriptional regulator (stage III sporulation protein D)